MIIYKKIKRNNIQINDKYIICFDNRYKEWLLFQILNNGNRILLYASINENDLYEFLNELNIKKNI